MSALRKFMMAAAVSGAAALTLAGGALASTVKVTNNTVVGTTNNITMTNVPDLGEVSGRAGAFHMTGVDTGDTPDSLVGSFVAFCIDLAHTLVVPATYQVSSGPVATAVQNLFDANYSADLANDADKAAAFQVALWQTLYGEFDVSGLGTTAMNLVTAYLDEADGYDQGRKWNLTMLVDGNPTTQDVIAVAPVPLPAAGFLLFGGLAGLGIAARRRKGTQA